MFSPAIPSALSPQEWLNFFAIFHKREKTACNTAENMVLFYKTVRKLASTVRIACKITRMRM
jgi:hypothetical protein